MTPAPAQDPLLAETPPSGCPIERTLEILDGKWTTLVLRELLIGPRRFGELRTALGNPSPKTLTDRLRILEHQGVLTRTVHAEIPPRVVYALTERGESLRSVLMAMLEWGEREGSRAAARPGSPAGA